MIIYKYTDLTDGKIYYGKTIGTLEERHKGHLSQLKFEHKRSYLHRAMAAHGLENFKLEEVEKCSSLEQLNEREKFYIARDNTTDPKIGFNLTKGGDGGAMVGEALEKMRKPKKKHSAEANLAKSARMKGHKHSLEAIEKMRAAAVGKKKSDEHRAALRKAKIGKPSNSAGKKRSKVSRKRMSDAHSGVSLSKKHRDSLSKAVKLIWAKRKQKVLNII